MKREYIPLQELAEEACELEINRLCKPIGKQDQYIATFGGLKILDIKTDGKVHVREAKLDDSSMEDLNRNLLMFYTGKTRSADKILSEQNKGVKEEKKSIVESMHYIKEIGIKILEAVESGNITEVGLLFDKHWHYKKRISPAMSNPQFDEIYNIAKRNGALGGKISGAGGGGFFLFYVEENHSKFRAAMKKLNLREMRYRFDSEGTKVIVNIMEGVT
jgi:D-glycero-alpha-D-manno-heptose-7-phosphate kinase